VLRATGDIAALELHRQALPVGPTPVDRHIIVIMIGKV